MTRIRQITFLATAAVVPLVAFAVTGCGGDDNNNDATAAAPPPKTASGGSATVGLANSGLGKILVDSQGRTVYPFLKDAGTKSACFGECASDWPPVRANGSPTVGQGLAASKVGTTARRRPIAVPSERLASSNWHSSPVHTTRDWHVGGHAAFVPDREHSAS